MVKIREKQTEQLEKAASKGLKLGGWKKMTLSSKIAAVVLVLVALTAILAPLLAPYSPVEIFTARQAPGNGFIFGTDDKGRDILSRMLYGGRYSLIIGFGATAMALVCGSVVGALAAVSRKAVSETIMRILDIIMSIPGIALAAVFVSILGNSVPSIIFAIGFMYTPQIARIVRANIVSEYGEDYVRAVIVSGAKAPWILIKHVLRNCIAPIMVFTVTLVADAIIFEASLTFIGAGIQEPTATWGNILADARGGVLAGRCNDPKSGAGSILWAPNPGMEGGQAIAEIILGEVNPSGRLPITFPCHAGQLPVYYNQIRGQHGNRYADLTQDPAFAFGEGEGYTTFAYGEPTIVGGASNADGTFAQTDTVHAEIALTNTGRRAGTEVVQAYVGDVVTSYSWADRELKAFRRVTLEPGETATVVFDIPVCDCTIADADANRIVEPGEFELLIGHSSRRDDLKRTTFTVA